MSGYLGLEGKRALVTGGTKGVGQAVAAALREAGATVLTTARLRPDNLPNAAPFRSPLNFVGADQELLGGRLPRNKRQPVLYMFACLNFRG
jgi:NAD(P)-dependent dehydrogenase (short-subunit alcohol dehydrogenase family)